MPLDKEHISNREVLIDEAIAHLRYFCKLYGIDSLFIVGGYCRSIYMNKKWEVSDIDVASAYPDQALQLGGLFSSEILNCTPEYYKRTGTAAVMFKGDTGEIKIEFQGNSTNSYMFNEDVRAWIQSNNIDDVPLMNNIYGRDFTINSLVYSLEEDELFDPTGRGQKDFDSKIIKPLLPAEMLIKYNPLAALRAIRFAIRYNFFIDPELRNEMKNSSEFLEKAITHERIVKEIVKILKLDASKGIEMLKKFNLSRFLINQDIEDLVYLGDKDEQKT